MKVESSNISFQSQHVMLEVTKKQENLQFWVGDNPSTNSNGPPGVAVDISEKGLELQKQLYSNETNGLEKSTEDLLSDKDKQKVMLLEAFIEHLLGRKFKLILPKRIKLNEAAKINLTDGTRPVQSRETPRAGWGLIYDSYAAHYESEKMSFQTTGVVKTSDGKEINISLELNMSREFLSSQSTSIRAGDALRKDPLVVNFNAPAAALTDKKFSFDIDNDGSPDQISQLGAGSGFLSLDINNDGIINDGSELFGPKSGDGFSDLSQYDADKNGWIDENDAVFDKLRIWTKDENGNDTLFALGQKGIGAIYLGSAITPFSLKGVANKENGVIQKTGIFLNENGTAGTIQHVDLVI
jgi:hypothetical protein